MNNSNVLYIMVVYVKSKGFIDSCVVQQYFEPTLSDMQHDSCVEQHFVFLALIHHYVVDLKPYGFHVDWNYVIVMKPGSVNIQA